MPSDSEKMALLGVQNDFFWSFAKSTCILSLIGDWLLKTQIGIFVHKSQSQLLK